MTYESNLPFVTRRSSPSSHSSYHGTFLAGALSTPAVFFLRFLLRVLLLHSSVECFTRNSTVGIPRPSSSMSSSFWPPTTSNSCIPRALKSLKGMSVTPGGGSGKGGKVMNAKSWVTVVSAAEGSAILEGISMNVVVDNQDGIDNYDRILFSAYRSIRSI